MWPRPASPNTTRGGGRLGGSSLALPGAAVVPFHLRTLRRRSKSGDAPEAPRTTREEALYQVSTPPDSTRLKRVRPPTRRGGLATTGILPFF